MLKTLNVPHVGAASTQNTITSSEAPQPRNVSSVTCAEKIHPYIPTLHTRQAHPGPNNK